RRSGLVAARGDQALGRAGDGPDRQVACRAQPVVDLQRGGGVAPGAPVGRPPDRRLALPVLVAGEAPGDDDPVGRDGHGVERLAAGSAERRRLDLLPLPAVGRPPGDAVLVALDGARAHRHEALAERGDPGDRLLAGPVERPAGAAVDGLPGLAAVAAEPQAGADLAPDVLAPGDEDATLAGRDREGPLAVLAAHDLGERPLPAVVGPAPDGGVGLLAVADLADRQQLLAGGDDRGQRLAPGRGAVADELRLPV